MLSNLDLMFWRMFLVSAMACLPARVWPQGEPRGSVGSCSNILVLSDYRGRTVQGKIRRMRSRLAYMRDHAVYRDIIDLGASVCRGKSVTFTLSARLIEFGFLTPQGLPDPVFCGAIAEETREIMAARESREREWDQTLSDRLERASPGGLAEFKARRMDDLFPFP
jgi:hypothetical protein